MSKFLKIAIISVVSLCLILVVAGYVFLAKVDFNQYKESIITIVKDNTGRDLSIGDIKLKASFNPTVEISDVVFSNTKWAKNSEMVRAKSVEVSIALIPLISKSFVINTFKIKNATINLEENNSGQNNWTFDIKEASKTQKTVNKFEFIKSANANENAGVDMLSSVVIKEILLDDVTINYTNKDGKTQNYKIKKVDLVENGDENIDFNFDVNDGQYKGEGVLGALKLFNSNMGYPINAKVSVDNIKVDTKLKLYDVTGNLSFDGQAVVSDFIGKKSGFNESIDVEFKGNLQKIEAKIRKLDVAKNIVTGEVVCDLSGGKPNITGSLNSDKIELSSFSKSKKTALKTVFIKNAVATELVSNSIVPYDLLYMFDMNMDVNIAQILNNNVRLGDNLGVNVVVNNGVANISIPKGVVADGKVNGLISLNANNKNLKINTSIENLKLVDLFNAFDLQTPSFNITSGGNTDMYVNVVSVGDTYSSLFENLEGNSVIIVNKSVLHLGNIDAIKGNIISQLFNTLKLTKGNDNLDMSCAVVRADFKDKKALFPNGIAVNADKFTVVADGDINLKNDKLSISIKPFAGKITDTNIAKALSSLVKLTGTISNPKIGVDGANAIKTIVGVTTAGPVYLGSQMLLENDGSPCYTALVGTGYENKFPKPKNVVSTTTEDVGKLLDDSVGVVKDTTKGLLNLLTGNGK